MRTILQQQAEPNVSIENMQRDISTTMEALAQDKFRGRFILTGKELNYLNEKGLDVVIAHAAELLKKRLAPAVIPNDGKQTPWRGHPTFIAQHATGTCCRGCLRKWHGIEKGKGLSDEEFQHVLKVLAAWLSRFVSAEQTSPRVEPQYRQLEIWQ